jgi:hypothetical protein
VLVIDKPGGWVRNELWQLNETEASFWDQYVPAGEPNQLFFDAQCSMMALESHSRIVCDNSCSYAFGNDSRVVLDSKTWNYNFFWDESVLAVVNGTYPGLTDDEGTMTSGLRLGSDNLTVDYCLAEPIATICCKC